MKLFLCFVLFMSVGALETTEEKVEKIETRIDSIEGSIQEILTLLKNPEDVRVVHSESSNIEDRLQALEFQMNSIPKDVSIIPSEPSDNLKMNNMEERFKAVEFKMGDFQEDMTNQEDVSIANGEPSDNLKMNDTEIEERVQILEFQMGNVQEDLTSVVSEVADLEEDVETQITNIEVDISVLLQGQLNQDVKIDDLEDASQGLTDSFDELDTRVTTLESLNGTDESVLEALNELEAEVELLNGTVSSVESEVELLNGTISNLKSAVTVLEQNDLDFDVRLEELESLDVANQLDNLDSRLDDLELDGAVAFHVEFSGSPVIPIGGIAVWDVIYVNLGDGYNSVTGEFVVPSGGAGLYYFYTHILFDNGEQQYLNIRHNGNDLCMAYEDNTSSGDYGGSSCGAVVVLAEGDIIGVYNSGMDDTPCFGGFTYSTFSGFRIAPQ